MPEGGRRPVKPVPAPLLEPLDLPIPRELPLLLALALDLPVPGGADIAPAAYKAASCPNIPQHQGGRMIDCLKDFL